MDVTLPNGQVINGVPEGTTKAQLAQKLQANGMDVPKEWMSPAAPVAAPADAASRVHDTGSGMNSGIASILGLPVDTLMNAWDLGKAAVGTAQGAMTGKTPSEIFEPSDRSKIAGTGDYIRNLMNKTPVTDTTLSHPEDTASRYLHTAGSALPGVMMANPTTVGQAASATAANIIPSLVGQFTAEKTKGTQFENTAPILASLATQAAPSAVSYAAKAMTPKPDASTAHAAQVLENAGVDLDASQKTGGLKTLKKLVQDNPFTAGSEGEKAQTQKQQFTQAVLKLMGEDAPAATASVMDRAQKRIGGVMDRVETNTTVPYNAKLHTDLQDVLQAAKSELVPGDYSVIESQVGNLVQKAFASPNGGISGEAIARARQALNRIGMGNNPSLKEYSGQLKGILEDAVQGAASSKDVADYKEARQQYRIMKQIEPTLDKMGDGIISPARLPTSMAKGNAGKNQTVYGRGDQRLVELAQAGNKLLPDRSPNSGTPARAMVQALPTAVAAAAGHLFLNGNPLPAIGVATGTVGAPLLARKLLNSPTALTGQQSLSPGREMQYATANAAQMTPEQRRKLIAEAMQ